MKKRFIWALCALMMAAMMPQKANANDYLENEDHYKITASGINKLHFKIPVWASDGHWGYHAYDDDECSYICYSLPDEPNKSYHIAYYKSDPYSDNEDNDGDGNAYLNLKSGMGEIIVTSMKSGVKQHIYDTGAWSNKLIVTQKEDDGYSKVTFLEFDWYPPVSLDSVKFIPKIEARVRRINQCCGSYERTCSVKGEVFTGNNNTITPRLTPPFLYTINETGMAGYGYAAISYTVFQEPLSYHTSFNPEVEVTKDVERSGMLYVMTNDTIQKNFSATFTIRRDKEATLTMKVTSDKVDIPPYHRIYDFAVTEETDTTGTYTGNNILTWNIRNPQLRDMMSTDYFEIQRAFKSDFSDAESIHLKTMTQEASGKYTYTDADRSTWTGNTKARYDTLSRADSYTARNFIVTDENGEPMFSADVEISSKQLLPAVPVYYRIRRASSSMWGWEHDFAKKADMKMYNYLAPLADTQENYTLDSDFENNRKVNFRIKLENRQVEPEMPDRDSCQLSYSNIRLLTDDYCVVYVDTFDFNKDVHVFLSIIGPYGEPIVTDLRDVHIYGHTFLVPTGSVAQFRSGNIYGGSEDFTIDSSSKFSVIGGYGDLGAAVFIRKNPYSASQYTPTAIDLERWAKAAVAEQQVKEQLLDTVYSLFRRHKEKTKYGRCMWDRTALLILRRTIEETGQTMEFIIPQDSIRRQPDGSWIAAYSDIANQGCSHYSYSVRIDQSRSDLHVQDSAFLLPVPIYGQDLYLDEAAKITSFTATQGDATTAMKPGVSLRWQVNSNAVDQFVLLRKETGSTDSADTLYRGTEYDWFDRSAMPDVHYDYTIVANYTCNGRTTSNSQTAEGWRTPYGEISGSLLMPDNSGMAGVVVKLTDTTDAVIRTTTTNAAGAYRFDSLEYSRVIHDRPQVTISFPDTLAWLSQFVEIRRIDPFGGVVESWHQCTNGEVIALRSQDEYTRFSDEGGGVQTRLNYPIVPNSGEIFTFHVKDSNIVLHCGLAYDAGTRLNCYKPYMEATSAVGRHTDETTTYKVMPTHEFAQFSYNYTTAGSAAITLSPDNAVGSEIDFMNTSTARLTGRVLYKNSTIPVSGAMFLLNGDTVHRGGAPLTSGIDGNFALTVTKGQPYQLQVFKPGHVFEGDGILRVEQEKDSFALTKPLDGVRFYDMTKVRLVGRVAGGNDQRDLPRGFGIGKNNLGDSLQLVLQLEGDNTAHIVHDPDDLSRDTIRQTVPHIVYTTDPLAAVKERTVGTTQVLFEKKRIIIHPDPKTGEFAVDLFPVKYKVMQATATGYATLFAGGQGSETFDLINAPLSDYNAQYVDSAEAVVVAHTTASSTSPVIDTYPYDGGIASEGGLVNGDSIHYNAVYDRIYHAPVEVTLTQLLYGLEKNGYGEEELEVSSMHPTQKEKVRLYNDTTGEYLLGYPVFLANRRYQFVARAFERYYYNNDKGTDPDQVPQRGGMVFIHNGLASATARDTVELDNNGKGKQVLQLEVKDIDTENSGTAALRSVSSVLQVEGNYVETTVFQAFVSGLDVQEGDLTSTDSEVVLLDIIRDPGGNGSSAWVESGTTYDFSYTESYDLKFGLNITPTYGVDYSQDMGAIAAPSGAGTYLGSNVSTNHHFTFNVPLTTQYKWGHKYNYRFTTTERISTSSGHTKNDVGSNADVFLGTTVSQLAGKAKSVGIISDSMFIARKPARDAGLMKVLGEGTAADGKKYHLVTGQQIVLGSTVQGTFVYTQAYILNTLIPKLALERQNLLMNFPDSASAQAYANQTGESVYWLYNDSSKVSLTDTLPSHTYKWLTPTDGRPYTNRVAALDNMIRQWCAVLILNEKEKVTARMMGSGSEVGVWSVSSGATVTHTDSYSASAQYSTMPSAWPLTSTVANGGANGLASLAADAENLKDYFKFLKDNPNKEIGKTVRDAINAIQGDRNAKDSAQQQEMGTKTAEAKWTTKYVPVFDFENVRTEITDQPINKSCGFTIGADSHGDITVAVYRANVDSAWLKDTKTIRKKVDVDDDKYVYGSYVFHTVAGSSYCPHEEGEKTKFYNKGTVLNNETQWVDKPELSIDTHEQTGIMPDKRATFRVTLMNNGQVQTGAGAAGTAFELSLWPESNPDGAKLYMDGAPMVTGIPFYLVPGEAVTKTIEVERGMVDDYNNLKIGLALADCPKTNTTLDFSVHFLPVSSDVVLNMPRQNWVMNTLSAHDSIGFYLPVEIDGFDIHHKNFDHIEFQYKLSTESEDMWVNQCSFYASDSLYALATGNKAMIRNGRITPFRFYGERDPMEQKYDLRAVTFCRYGSGFVTKASPVMSGTKDTRPPVAFGDPEPANSILGVGDRLKLRFNEAIAGNYLDEDNNFQIAGVTNETGITAATALHFDGNGSAYTKAKRDLRDQSYTIDMMIRPAVSSGRTKDMVLFETGTDDYKRQLILTRDNRLRMEDIVGGTLPGKSSRVLDQMLAFTRVLAVYDNETQEMRFYVGNVDVTEQTLSDLDISEKPTSAYFRFGEGYEGDMLETRIWTKPLTLEEITATADRHLTGYERELLAYYRMDEGKGETVTDHAHGATLYLDGCSWNQQKGFSLRFEGGSERAKLDGNRLSRSKVYDETLMFWFKAESDGTLFSAGRQEAIGSIPAKGTLLSIENGGLVLRSGDQSYIVNRQIVNDSWHHLALTVSRAYNSAALFVDGEMMRPMEANRLEGITGAMYLGGNGFKGNIDEFAVFEQALPKTLVEIYGDISLTGDEMGLVGYLPFEEQFLNKNGILELGFSVNDRRIIRNPETGEVIDKVVPLIDKQTSEALMSARENAPIKSNGLLSKLYFNWAFNNDELMINILNRDYEVNKQSIYVTVRDVEDLNGNPMPSPVTWTAFVDRNSLKWSAYEMNVKVDDGTEGEEERTIQIINHSGKRHTYRIESLPSWLSVDRTYGSLDPTGQQTLTLTFNREVPVGEYSDIIYLTDEEGLAEPLQVVYEIAANPPYEEVDVNRDPYNMSVCGQVILSTKNQTTVYDTDSRDIVYALFRNKCVGMANVAFDPVSNTSEVFMTIHGSEAMFNKEMMFVLWQASTGKVLNLTPSRKIVFAHGNVNGCANEEPVLFTTSGAETQNIQLLKGWNWVSTNLDLQPATAEINTVMSASEPWREGDLIKNPSDRQFCTYSVTQDQFLGELKTFDYTRMYMVYVAADNTMRLNGNQLDNNRKAITLAGNGQWTAFPCLLSYTTPVTEALADYYEYATPGDLIKAHNRFAVFSNDKRWIGDLTSVTPGDGYLFRRLGDGDVTIGFYDRTAANAPKKAPSDQRPRTKEYFSNPDASSNMTMIATIVESQNGTEPVESIRVYVGDELAGVAEPLSLEGRAGEGLLYFLTVQSDKAGQPLRFETEDGTPLQPVDISTSRHLGISYAADTHHGSLKAPVLLKPGEPDRPYKVIEDNHVVIIRGGEKYDVTGKKLSE